MVTESRKVSGISHLMYDLTSKLSGENNFLVLFKENGTGYRSPMESCTAVGIGGAGTLAFRFLKLISCSHHLCLTWPIQDGEDSGLLAGDTACPPLRACQHFQSGPWWAGAWAEWLWLPLTPSFPGLVYPEFHVPESSKPSTGLAHCGSCCEPTSPD